jgi:Flp pilus assembly protein TadG
VRRRVRSAGVDRGAAVVDFAMMSVLLVFLLMAVLQVAVYFYVRNVVSSSAADAARFAAAKDVPLAAGTSRAQELLEQGLDANDADAIHCGATPGRDGGSGLPTVTVRCRGRIRLLFLPLGAPLTVDVQSTVLKEGVAP